MKSLERKMLRDLWELRGQALAIMLVIAAGVASYIMSASTLEALQKTRQDYYREYRYAEVFASLQRAPRTVEGRIADIPGVDRVQTRVVAAAQVDLPGFSDPVTGRLVSLPDTGEPILNNVHLRRGRMVDPGRDDEVLVSEAFAEAHGLAPGDSLAATIKGRRKTLRITGIVLSPEYIYQIAPGRVLPDFQRYAVMWMAGRPLAAAWEMEDGFNDVALGLAPGALVEDVVDSLDLILGPYGGLGAYGREEQVSHRFLSEDIRQLRQTSGLFSAIFLGVTAFLLNVVMGRLVNTQREQVAILKAFGYSDARITAHYLGMVLVVTLAGVAAGTGAGAWLGGGLSELYMDYYRFPYLRYGVGTGPAALAAGISVAAAVTGAFGAIRRAATLPPAEAMRPETPEAYRPALVERAGLARWLGQPTRMILRHLERRPWKSLMTVAGMAMACAVMIVGTFFRDAMDYMVEIQFGVAYREDVAVTFYQPTSYRAVYELAAMPGVQRVEPYRALPVVLSNGPRSYRTAIEGYQPDAVLHRALDVQHRPLDLPGDGLLLTDQLAGILGLEPGDAVLVEALEGRRRREEAVVAGVVRQYIGIGAYTTLASLNRLAGEGEAVSGAYLAVDERDLPDLFARFKEVPRIAATEASAARLRNFYESIAEFLLTYVSFVSALAGAIVFGIVYNSARIALAERSRELASLRVLGYTRAEVSWILLGELALLTLLAIPPGFLAGRALAAWLVASLPHELFRIPLVLERETYALAATVVMGAALISGLLVRRRVDRLDLVAVLKTRE